MQNLTIRFQSRRIFGQTHPVPGYWMSKTRLKYNTNSMFGNIRKLKMGKFKFHLIYRAARTDLALKLFTAVEAGDDTPINIHGAIKKAITCVRENAFTMCTTRKNVFVGTAIY